MVIVCLVLVASGASLKFPKFFLLGKGVNEFRRDLTPILYYGQTLLLWSCEEEIYLGGPLLEGWYASR